MYLNGINNSNYTNPAQRNRDTEKRGALKDIL